MFQTNESTIHKKTFTKLQPIHFALTITVVEATLATYNL